MPSIYIIISVRFNVAPYFQLKKCFNLISDRFLNNARKSGPTSMEKSPSTWKCSIDN